MKTRSGLVVISVIAAAALAGCSGTGGMFGGSGPVEQKPSGLQAGNVVGGATEQIKKDVQPVSDFLPRPELLAPGGPGRPALVYVNPQADPTKYRTILLDPVTVKAGAESELRKVPASQQRQLANLLYADLYNALKAKCTMVRKTGPGTIHFHVALVDTKEPNTVVNTVATYVPYASAAYAVSSRVFNKGVGYFAGTATLEAYAQDGGDGSLLWEAVDKRGGTTAVVANTLDNWRDVRHAFEAWGVQFRTRLQEIGVCRK